MKKDIFEKFLKEYFRGGIKAFLPHVSINFVILGYDHPSLRVLVSRVPGQKAVMLPGGYVRIKEDLEDAALRNLKLSGIDEVFLRQVRTFGNHNRIPEFFLPEKKSGINRILKWATKRFVTVTYYGLVDYRNTKVKKGGLMMESAWIDIRKTGELVLDHPFIVSETRKILATDILNYPVILNLLPDSFTLNEIQGLYEAILDRKIDKGSLRRKMLGEGIIGKVEKRKSGVGRPSVIYRINRDAYSRSLEEQAKFGF